MDQVEGTSGKGASEKTPREDRDVLRDLMVGYQCGSEDAAEELVRRLSPALLRFLETAAWDRSRAQDLLQECWIRIHRSRHTYDPSLPILPWIYSIARHTRLDGYRRRRRRDTREVPLEEARKAAAPPAPNPDGIRPDLDGFLGRLPESQREVLLMLKISGMSLEEVARATESTVGAVKQKAHRAYEKLREMMRGEKMGPKP